MPPKGKEVAEIPKSLIHPQVDFHHTPLVDRNYKTHESLSEFDLFEICCWMEDQLVDQMDEIGFWDSHLPHYIFPQIYRALESVRKYHASYDPTQIAIISPTREIMCSINAQSIEQMLQAPTIVPTHPFSHESLIEAYQKLDFTKRAQTLEIFLAVDNPLPKRNPPYGSSIFPDLTKQITTILSYLLGYYSDQHVDEAIIGFLSIFSVGFKPIVHFNFS